MFVGFNLTFWPQFVVGLRGMPRRIVDYAPGLGWETPNLVSSLGVVVLASGVLLFLVDAVTSWRRRTPRATTRGAARVGHVPSARAQLHGAAPHPLGGPVFDMHHPELQGDGRGIGASR